MVDTVLGVRIFEAGQLCLTAIPRAAVTGGAKLGIELECQSRTKHGDRMLHLARQGLVASPLSAAGERLVEQDKPQGKQWATQTLPM